MYRIRGAILMMATVMLMGACATPVNKAPDRAFKKLDFGSAKAVVYVGKPYSPSNCGGVPLDRGVTVSISGKKPVKVDCEEYAVLSVDPGRVNITVDKALDLDGGRDPLITTLEGGKEYCLNIHWRVERLPGMELKLLPGSGYFTPRYRAFLAYSFGQNCVRVFDGLYRVHEEPFL